MTSRDLVRYAPEPPEAIVGIGNRVPVPGTGSGTGAGAGTVQYVHGACDLQERALQRAREAARDGAVGLDAAAPPRL